MSAVVITGARGYIGSALVRQGSAAGEVVRPVSRADADLADMAAWRRLLDGASAVIHLSWRTDLRAAEADPVGDERINIAPVRALIQAAATIQRPPLVLFASAVTIVGLGHANPVDEKTPDRPVSVYDRHKLIAEQLLHDATAQGVLRAASLRLSNVYGHGRASTNGNRGVLNTMMRRAARGEALKVYGDDTNVRDFIHVDDVVAAFCAALRAPEMCDGRHYVVATGEGHSLGQAFAMVADEAQARTGRRVAIDCVRDPPDLMPIERRNFVGNPALFRDRAGWQPRIRLREGIRASFGQVLADAPTAGAT